MSRPSIPAWLTTALVAVIALSGAAIFLVLQPSDRLEIWRNGMSDMGSFVVLSALATGVALALHHARPFNRPWLGLLPIGALVCLFVSPVTFAGVLIQFTSAFLVGYALLSRVWKGSRGSDAPSPLEALILAFLSLISGLALFGTMLWALSHIQVNTAGAHALMYIALGFAAVASLRGTGFSLLRPAIALRSGLKPDFALSLLVAPGLISTLALLCMVGLPELSSDTRSAYASFFEFLRFHGYWSHDPSQAVWALQPLGGLYLAASNYLMGGQEAVRLGNTMMMMLGLGGASLIAGLVSGHRLAAAAAFSLAATIPLYLELTAEYYYDNAVAAFIIAAALCLFMLVRTRSSQDAVPWVLALALALAGASSTKHTAWIMTVVLGFLAVVIILLRQDKPLRSIVLLIGAGAGLFTVLVLPIVVAAYVQTGNPVFPYYNQIFQSPFYLPVQHGTPHPGYLHWDVFIRAVFDTRAFSSSDLRGGFGITILMLAPALVMGISTTRSWLAALLCVSFAAIFVLLSAMQNDLRLLWPISLALFAGSAGLIGIVFDQTGPVRSVLIASLAATAGLQLLLMPAGGHNIPGTNITNALTVEGEDRLTRLRAPDTIINSMLDGLPERAVRRMFLSTWKGPSAATNVEDSWYTDVARQRILASRSEETMLETLQALAPDAVVMGIWEQRIWLDSSLYALLNQHALQIFDYPDHRVFLMDNAIAYPEQALPAAQSAELIDQLATEGELLGPGPIQIDFQPAGPTSEQFRARFLARCEREDVLHVVVAVRGPYRLYEYTLTTRPCEGEGTAFQVTVPATLPVGGTFVTLMVKTQSGDRPFAISNLEAGFKNRLDREASLELRQ